MRLRARAPAVDRDDFIAPSDINDRSWAVVGPQDWIAMRLRFLSRINPPRSSLPITSPDIDVAFLPMERAREHTPRFNASTMRLSEIAPGLTPFRDGDVLLAKITPCFENGKGGIATELTGGVGFGSTEFHVMRPSASLHREFLYYLATSQPVRAVGASQMQGSAGQKRVPSEFLSDLVVAVPSFDEQRDIARFLRHMDRRINKLIRAKRRLIELLNEQKQAIINRAVTRGLDPDVRLRPSGIDWLGDVPEHWDVRRLKSLCAIKTGGRDTVDRVDDAPYPFFVRSQVVERIDTYSFDGEAVLKAGDGAGVAKVFHYVDGKFDFHQRVYRFSNFQHSLAGRFFYYYLMSNLRFEAFRETAKSTVDSLRLPMLQAFPVALPPRHEQVEIVAKLDRALSNGVQATSRAQHEIELLREYRTRLIADVVTGKLDVRGVELPPLEDDEPLDDIAIDDETEEPLDEDEADAD